MDHTVEPTYSDDQVTASDLVRQFGVWQDKATHAPVYVMHRGRPKLVLLSVGMMDALCSRAELPTDLADQQRFAIIDSLDEAAILLDQNAKVVHFNRHARTRFPSVAKDSPIQYATDAGATFLAGAAQRVISTGTSETLQVASASSPSRELLVKIEAVPHGCIMLARDATAADELRQVREREAALVRAVEAGGTIATFRLNTRGQFIAPGRILADLIGSNPHQLSGNRLTTIIAAKDRIAVGQAVDNAFDHGSSDSLVVDIIASGSLMKRAVLNVSRADDGSHNPEVNGIIALTSTPS